MTSYNNRLCVKLIASQTYWRLKKEKKGEEEAECEAKIFCCLIPIVSKTETNFETSPTIYLILALSITY